MRPAGFTLIEVLVALLIGAVTIAGLAAGAGAATKGRITSERNSAMALLAETSLEEMLAFDPREVSTTDEIAVQGALFARERTVRRAHRENLWLLEVSVTAPGGGGAVVMRTLRRSARSPWP